MHAVKQYGYFDQSMFYTVEALHARAPVPPLGASLKPTLFLTTVCGPDVHTLQVQGSRLES